MLFDLQSVDFSRLNIRSANLHLPTQPGECLGCLGRLGSVLAGYGC